MYSKWLGFGCVCSAGDAGARCLNPNGSAHEVSRDMRGCCGSEALPIMQDSRCYVRSRATAAPELHSCSNEQPTAGTCFQDRKPEPLVRQRPFAILDRTLSSMAGRPPHQQRQRQVKAVTGQGGCWGPEEHINIRILQHISSGIPLILGLRTKT